MLMVNPTFLDGKEYISASRASKRAGYSEDYIGQLCRTKKISGQLVGRTWYVDLNSLLEHKKNQKYKKKEDSEETDVLNLKAVKNLSFSYAKEEVPLFPRLLKMNSNSPRKKSSVLYISQGIITVFIFATLITGTSLILSEQRPSFFNANNLGLTHVSVNYLKSGENLLDNMVTSINYLNNINYGKLKHFVKWQIQDLSQKLGEIPDAALSDIDYQRGDNKKIVELEARIRHLEAQAKEADSKLIIESQEPDNPPF